MPLAALWFLLIQLILGNPTSEYLRKHLKDFDVVSSPRRHCTTGEVHPRFLNYSFVAYDKVFHLELTKVGGLFAPGYKHTVFDAKGDVTFLEAPQDCYYHGVVVGDNESQVAVSTCSGGLTGSIVGHGHDFFLEPLHETPARRNLMEIPDHAIYRIEDHHVPMNCGNMAHHNHEHDHHDHEHDHHDHHEHRQFGGKRESFHWMNSSLHGRHLKTTDSNWLQAPEFSSSSNSLPVWIEIMVINDQVRAQSANVVGAISTEDIVFQMDSLYRRNTAFSPPIRLRLVAQESWLSGNKFAYTITAKGEVDQTDLLRDMLRYRYDHLAELPQHDSLMLFTGQGFIGAISGLAYEQVLCSPTKSGAVAEMTRTLGMNAAIAAHELGHNLGMSHDGTGNLCPVSGFIMAGVLSLGAGPDSWSQCSADALARFFTMFQPTCVSTEEPKQGSGPTNTCGDGFIAGNEQCDCGSRDCSKSDPCCDGTTCRFVAGAQCSAKFPCCSQCKIVPASAMKKCSDPGTNQCQFPRYCDGYKAQCSPSEFANVGTVCSVPAIPPQVGMLEGKCYRGLCWSQTLQCQQERFDTGCTSPNAALLLGSSTTVDAECGMLWCIQGKAKICTLIAGEGPKYKNDGTPCGTSGTKQCYQGVCTTSYLLPGATPPTSTTPGTPPRNGCLGETCSGHGICVGSSGACACYPGWTGRLCNLPTTSNPFPTNANFPTSPPTPSADRKPVPFFTLSQPPTPPTNAPTRDPSLPPTRAPSPPPTRAPSLPPTNMPTVPTAITRTTPSPTSVSTPTARPTSSLAPTDPVSPTSLPTSRAPSRSAFTFITPTNPPTYFSMPPLPPMAPLSAPIRSDIVASRGMPFLFNSSQYFFSPNGEALIFSAEGLPTGTGLRLDPAAGFMFGTPTDADVAASPIALKISARSSGGIASLNAFLRIDSSQRPPRSLGISPILAFDTDTLDINLADSFVDDDKNPLTFAIDGLPPGTGLQLTPNGRLQGVPNPIDVIAQPFRITVTADDGHGGTAVDTTLITIMSAAGASMPGGPSTPLLIPTQCLREGTLFQLELQPYFPGTADCRFSLTGLPSGSGLRFDVGNRILYGAPNRADVVAATQQALTVTVIAADNQGRTVQQTCLLSIDSATTSPKNGCIATSTGATEVNAVMLIPDFPKPMAPAPTSQFPPARIVQPTPAKDSVPWFSTKLLPTLPGFTSEDRDATQAGMPPLAATIGRQTATVDFPFTLDVTPYFIDRQKQPLTFAATGLSSSTGLTFDTNGQLSGTPLQQGVGPSRVTITAVNPQGLSASTTFDLIINDRYRVPTPAAAAPPAPSTQPPSAWPLSASTPALAPSPTWPLPSANPPAIAPTWPLPNSPSATATPWPLPAPPTPAQVPSPSWPLPPRTAPTPATSAIPRSSKDCQTLQWNARGQTSVCASASDNQGQCLSASAFPVAVNLCSKLGARMCTFAELSSGIGVGPAMACPSNVWWTSRICDGGVQVYNASQLDPSINCQAATQQLGVMCCADAADQGRVSSPPPALTSTSLAVVILPRVTTVGTFQYFPLASSFGGSQLRYSMQGLPQGTGFQLDANSGTLFGSASLADMLASPISILIRAASQTTEASSQGNFVLTVLQNVTSTDPVAALIPSSSATVNRPFLLDISPFFTDPQRDRLTFTMSGLPESSGFRFMPSGVFFGAATQADLRAPQPLSIRVTATNSRQGQAVQVLILSILSADADSSEPSERSNIRSRAFAPASAIVGQPFFVDLSQHFIQAPGDYLSFSVQGLPVTTGFVVDPIAGVLYGSATQSELLNPQPITLRVLADNKKGSSAEQALYLTIVAGSEQGCKNLNWRAFDSMPDVCSNTAKPDGTCPSPVSFRVAENMCRAQSARLCTSDELMADISSDPSCGLDNSRVWTSTLCPDGTVYTQAGSSLFISSFLPVCTPKSGQYAFKCCADKQTAPSGNKNIRITATAAEGSDFQLDLSTYFTPPAPNSALTYLLTPDFPAGTGLTMSAKGRISGRPTRSDVLRLSNASLLVTVQDGAGWSLNMPLILTVKPQTNRSPILLSQIDSKFGNVGAQVYFPIGTFFSDPDNDPLSFSLSNIPANTGFGIDPLTGAVFGVLTMADLGNQLLNITAFDGKGGSCSVTLLVNVTQNSPPLSVGSIPQTVANRGQPFEFRLATYFVDPDRDQLTYSLTGLPSGTGFTLDPNSGILAGSPSLADIQSIQPLTARVQVSDGRGGRAYENVVIIARDNQSPNAQVIPIQSGKERTALYLALSDYFQDPDGDRLTLSLVGLPRDSGLKIDRSSGILAGIPSSSDAGPVQPWNLTVTADDGRGGSATQSFLLVILNSQGTNAPVGITPPPGGWGSSQRTVSYHRDSTRDIMYGVIPPMEAMVNQPFFRMLSLSFTEFDGKKPEFTQIQGLPSGTGLVLSADGVLAGVPSAVDAAARQPLQLTVIAVDATKNKEVRKTLALTITSTRAPSIAPTSQPTAAKPSDTTGAIVMDAEVGKSISIQVSPPKQFQVALNQFKALATLQARQAGLPFGSGLSLDPISGTLSGVPNNADLAAAEKGLGVNVTFMLQTPVGTQLGQVILLLNIQPPQPARSPRSCDELGWTTYEMLGVCANSQLRGCTVPMSYTAATGLCSSAGGRLCTMQELRNDAAKGSGCDLDLEKVWSADECAGGALVTTGSSSAANIRLCATATDKYRVRCCADMDWGIFTRQFDDETESPSPSQKKNSKGKTKKPRGR